MTRPEVAPEFVSLAEVARRYSVTPATLRLMAREGRLPGAVWVGHRLKVRADRVAELARPVEPAPLRDSDLIAIPQGRAA